MSRIFCIPGIILLFIAVVVSFLASISLPYLPALDITRVEFNDTSLVADEMTNLRFGIWTSCYYNEAEDKTCQKNAVAYETTIAAANSGSSNSSGDDNDEDEVETEFTVKASWTRGLVIQPLATAVTVIAFCLSFSTHRFVTLISSAVAFLAAIMHLCAFAVDLALFAYVKRKVDNLEIKGKTTPAPGLWLTFACMLLCLLAACSVCFGRRRDRSKADAAAAAAALAAAPTEKDIDEPAPAPEAEKKSGFLSRFSKKDKEEIPPVAPAATAPSPA